MAIAFRFNSRNEIPAEQAALYVERDGAWFLDADGIVDKASHDEMRAANIALRKQVEDLTARLDGIDPAEVRKVAE